MCHGFNDMAKKKEITRIDIISAYMQFTLENGKQPDSVFAFAKHISITESEFYNFFGSFEKVERSIFKAFFDNTIELLNKNEAYKDFDAKSKLISFYYTFFELLKANRSYVVFALNKGKHRLNVLNTLSELKKSFTAFVQDLGIETIDLKQEKLEKAKNKGLLEWSWAQLLFILKFWLEDGSANFEKTDVLIEKSITTGFALLDTATLNSVFDLGKFLFKEKVMSN